MAILTLPTYPSSRTRASLSPSQLATLTGRISGALAQFLPLPASKRDTPSAISFVSAYAKDHAQALLESLIWDSEHDRRAQVEKLSTTEKSLRQRVLKLAQQLAGELDLQNVIDLCVVFGPTNPKSMRSLLGTAVASSSRFSSQLDADAVSAFTALLSNTSQGLYGVRKIAHVLLTFLKPAPAEVLRPFARSKHLILSLANAYEGGLSSLARSYGGFASGTDRTLDDWERVFLETKVDLLDTTHVLLRTLLADAKSASSGVALEAAFEVVFALLENPHTRAESETPTPFLNQTLLEDMQNSFDFAKLAREATRAAGDGRTDLLDASLRALDLPASGQDKAGALKLLIRSSGAPPGIDARGRGPSVVDKGKARAVDVAPPPKADPALDAAVAQVLDILPEQSPEYLRYVLSHPDYPFKGDAERLIGALLEGTAPTVDESQIATLGQSEAQVVVPHVETRALVMERRNVFDEEKMDLSKLRVGKKTENETAILQDRAYIEQMKADILRRAEAMSDEEDEDDVGTKGKPVEDVAAWDDLYGDDAVKVRDGVDSEDEGSSDDDEEGGEDATPKSPETILELAYISDPKLFDRDMTTRRSKGRADLKARTGWADEQIEGWRIMLERNSNKDKILQKHEFSGNQRGVLDAGPSQSHAHGRGAPRGGRGRGGGGGAGRGRGRGGGGGGGQGGAGGDGGSARDRAWKDKNKASRGNHNRKRGHDKKMARVAGPS